MRIREFFEKYPVDLTNCGSQRFFQECADGQWVPVDPLAHAAVQAGFDFLEGQKKGVGITFWFQDVCKIPRAVTRVFHSTWDLWYTVGHEQHAFDMALRGASQKEDEGWECVWP